MTRRSAFAIGGAGTIGLIIGSGRAQAGQAVSVRDLTVTGTAADFATFSDDFRQRSVNAIPSSIGIVAPVPLGDTTVRVDFDAAFLELSDPVAHLIIGDAVTSVPMSIGEGTVALRLAGSIAATRAVLSLPFFTSIRYPQENVGPSTAPVVHVTVQQYTASAEFPLDQSGAKGLAWGGELDVSWQHRSVQDGLEYLMPGLLTLTSVGPGPIPAGTRIRVRSDAVVSEQLRPVPVPEPARIQSRASTDALLGPPPISPPDDPAAVDPSTSVADSRADGARDTDILLQDEIPAGKTFTTALCSGSSSSSVRVKAVTFAQASFEAPDAARPTQRITGSESVTSLAPGGLPLSTKMLTGAI